MSWEFRHGGQELIVRSPAKANSWPNLLFNQTRVLALDLAGQGESSAVGAKGLKPLTRGDRQIYLRDELTKKVWPMLSTAGEEYSAVYTPWATRFTRHYAGLCATIEVRLSPEGGAELWKIRLSQDGTTPARKLSLFYVTGLAYNAGRCTDAWWDNAGQVLLHFNPPSIHDFEKEHGRIHREPFYLAVGSDPDPFSWDASEFRFYGDRPGGWPVAVARGECSNRAARAVPVIAALHWKLNLPSGGDQTVKLFLDEALNPEAAGQQKKALFSAGGFEAGWSAAELSWKQALASPQIQTPSPSLDCFTNVWAKHQALLMQDLNRMESTITARNLLQDLLGTVLLRPHEAWRKFVAALRNQKSSGFVQRGWRLDGAPSPEGLDALNFRDGSVWVILVGTMLACQQENLSVLDEIVPFVDEAPAATVYEHLLRALQSLWSDVGAHDLSLLGQGDWNDALTSAGREGRGESVMLSATLILAMNQLLPIIRSRGDEALAARIAARSEQMARALNEHCWDGAWYVRGFADDGLPFGTSADRQAQIWLNAQTWPLLAGVVSPERQKLLLESVETRLSHPQGLTLLTPPFWEVDARLGAISTRLPGTRVNGSFYNHANAFAAAAFCAAGRGDLAVHCLEKMLPTNPENPPEVNLQVPTYIPNFYVGPVDDDNVGISSRMIGTASPAWFLWVMIEHVMGVRATVEGLCLTPCVPLEWKHFTLSRRFRGSEVRVSFANPDGVMTGVKSIAVNGQPVAGNVLRSLEAGRTYDVFVLMGSV